MAARYYAFNIGRFMTVDPVRGTIGSSQSWNAYSYVRNNPINRFDPFGMADKDKKPCEKGQPCAEGATAGQPPSAEPKGTFSGEITVTAKDERLSNREQFQLLTYEQRESDRTGTAGPYADPNREMLRVAGGGVPRSGFPYDPILDYGVADVSLILPIPKRYSGIPSTLALNLELNKVGLSFSMDWGPGGGLGFAAGFGFDFARRAMRRSALSVTLVGGADWGGGITLSNFGGPMNQTLRLFGGVGYGSGINVGINNLNYTRLFTW